MKRSLFLTVSFHKKSCGAFDHSRILDLGTQHSQLSTTEFVLALHKEFNSAWVCSVQAEYVQLVLGVCEARWTGSGRLDNQHIE